jgi:hypothetical protein
MLIFAQLLPVNFPDFLLRLFIDLAAISLFAGLLFLRRHGRRDLLVIFVVFNVGVFAALAVITAHRIGTGIGFGLFAILSIIRLRSEPFDNIELAYFFGSLILAVVNGFEQKNTAFIVFLNALVLMTVFLIDHQSFHATIRRRRITLDTVATDVEAVRRDLSERFGVEIVELAITDVDYVRETTRVVVRYVADPRTPAALGQASDDDD